jgi:integrase/recombinase XerD
MALQKGISLAAIQKVLGHDRTAIYTDMHVVDEYTQKW